MNQSGSRSKKNVKLSKSILSMKFMKPSRDKYVQEEAVEEEEKWPWFGIGLTEEMKEADRYFVVPNYVICKNLIDGRFSFNGMNPEIEKIMEEEAKEKRLMEEKAKEKVGNGSGAMDKDVTDEEMAATALTNSMQRKFASKNEMNGLLPKDGERGQVGD